MIRLIKWVLGLCNHGWEVYQEGRVVNPRGEVVCFWTHRKCSKCGKRKI